MSAAVAAGRRYLPRGYIDLVRQAAIWFGFLFAYQFARGLADRNPAKAFVNGWRVLDFEQRITHHVFELTLQQVANSSSVLKDAVAWTYWNSEFTIVGLALLWIYLRRNERFTRFRNAVLLANVLGLVGYILLPTAPPRMFPSLGFLDTLDSFGGLNHGSGIISIAANPYAAMPSLHAADALIVGIVLSSAARRPVAKALWLLWPVWVSFAVMASANHFWLDVLAGIALGALSMALVYRDAVRRLIAKLL
jgi:membrane-associated phospholipid phosphatase